MALQKSCGYLITLHEVCYSSFASKSQKGVMIGGAGLGLKLLMYVLNSIGHQLVL